MPDTTLSRRTYLILKACETQPIPNDDRRYDDRRHGAGYLAGTSITLAMEAVATIALSHPGWDMSEEKSWHEWEKMERQ
jgi:hypothetical protein